jgi:hypothetical protein
VLQRIALCPCVEQRLTQIRVTIEQGAARFAVLEAIDGYDPPRYSWDSLVFQGAIASGVFAHLQDARVWRWAYVYTKMPLLDRANERARLVEAVEALRRDNADIMAQVLPVAAAFKDLGVRVEAQGEVRTDQFSPSGSSRVIDQLRHLLMAASYLPALERAMGVPPQ